MMMCRGVKTQKGGSEVAGGSEEKGTVEGSPSGSICSDSYNRAADWVTHKLQTFISHTSGGRDVQGQGAVRFGVW